MSMRLTSRLLSLQNATALLQPSRVRLGMLGLVKSKDIARCIFSSRWQTSATFWRLFGDWREFDRFEQEMLGTYDKMEETLAGVRRLEGNMYCEKVCKKVNPKPLAWSPQSTLRRCFHLRLRTLPQPHPPQPSTSLKTSIWSIRCFVPNVNLTTSRNSASRTKRAVSSSSARPLPSVALALN